MSRLHFAERRACGKFGLGMPLWLMECVCEHVCVDVCGQCMYACMYACVGSCFNDTNHSHEFRLRVHLSSI